MRRGLRSQRARQPLAVGIAIVDDGGQLLWLQRRRWTAPRRSSARRSRRAMLALPRWAVTSRRPSGEMIDCGRVSFPESAPGAEGHARRRRAYACARPVHRRGGRTSGVKLDGENAQIARCGQSAALGSRCVKPQAWGGRSAGQSSRLQLHPPTPSETLCRTALGNPSGFPFRRAARGRGLGAQCHTDGGPGAAAAICCPHKPRRSWLADGTVFTGSAHDRRRRSPRSAAVVFKHLDHRLLRKSSPTRAYFR